MTAAVTVVAGGTLGAGSRAAKAAAPAQAMTASDAIGAIARGDLSAEEYAGALLARADELKDLNACILLNRDGLLEGARAIDVARRKGNKLGRLSGLPLLVKDNIDTKGMPTTGGAKALASNSPKQDAPVLSPLFESGALVMAKTSSRL